MKLIDRIRPQPTFISFGRSSSDSGLVNVELAASQTDSSVSITAADGSVAAISAASDVDAGVMSAADKSKLDGIPRGQGAPIEFASRSTIGAESVATAIEHLRTSGYLTVGDGGEGLYRRVTTEPAHGLKVQSADGAWWELAPESHVNVRQAGAVGDGVSDDSQAFLDAMAFASLNANSNDNATFGVIVPASDGAYYLGSTTLELKRTVHLVGQNAGQAGGKACRLLWDANVTGIIVHRANTIGATTESDPTTLSASSSRIEGLSLESAGGTIAGVTDATKGHGIWLRSRAVLQDLTITGFAGNGVHIVAQAGGSADVEGNANNWVINRARIALCHMNGVFVDGADTNAGHGQDIDVSSNGRWGIWDSSFLGNTWTACHTASNGISNVGENGAGESSFITYGGERYCGNLDATEAELVATTPGTDEGIWLHVGTGGVGTGIPTWTAAQPEGTYFAGGSFATDNANGRSVLDGCYRESGQGRAQIAKPTLVLGGNLAEDYTGTAFGITGGGELRGVVALKNHDRFSPPRDLTLSFNASEGKLMKLQADGDATVGFNFFAWDETNGQWLLCEHNNLASRRPLRITTDLNTTKHGRSVAQEGGALYLYKGFWIGNGSGQARWFGGFRSKPTNGDYARGDLMLNYNPKNPGEVAGWRLTTAGTVGSGAVLEEFHFVPELPTDRGAVLKPHASSALVEWAAAPKAGTATIADAAATQPVAFATAFPDANYSVAIAADGDETVWIGSKAASGFTLNRAGSSGARSIDWTATPHEDL